MWHEEPYIQVHDDRPLKGNGTLEESLSTRNSSSLPAYVQRPDVAPFSDRNKYSGGARKVQADNFPDKERASARHGWRHHGDSGQSAVNGHTYIVKLWLMYYFFHLLLQPGAF